MADPNAQPMHQHHLNQQHRAVQHQPLSIGGPGVPHLLLDPQTLAAAPPPLHPQHQFQPQHYSVLDSFWQRQVHEIRNEDHDFKVHQLPLARIKKVMKTDEEVKAPILFAKGCDIFITELTMRAWLHAEECKRRTLQRSDIANAIKKVDMFDFLIDIVPREEKVTVKTEKIEYPDHQSPYYGLGVPQGGHQFNTSSSIPIDHKIIVDSMAQQQVSSYRPQNHPQFSHVSANVSAGPVRQVTTDQPYQHHPYYHHSGFQQHSQELHHPQNQTPSQHHRQSEHNPVQVKYEFERSEWYPHQTNTQLNGHTQSGYGQHHVSSSSSHGYGQPLDQSSHEYNHENTGMHLTRHEEGYVRDGGVQRD
ncbi:13241_t:CDS:2 [Rhizophagus irregularis]|nr:13241_t:CDS:2 [Rhizophagus irregularis]